jgi:hypothetical protein
LEWNGEEVDTVQSLLVVGTQIFAFVLKAAFFIHFHGNEAQKRSGSKNQTRFILLCED